MMIATVRNSTLALIVGAGLAMSLAAPALAQPANNACTTGAQVLVVPTLGSISVLANNVNATSDGTVACAASSSDVWYRIIAPANGALTASTCSSATFNTVVAIRSSCPGLGATLACDNGGCGTAGRSTVTVACTAGTVYYVRVASAGFQNPSTQGLFTLTLTHGPTPPPPPSPQPVLGPDVVVNQITDVARWGTDVAGTTTAYSVGTDSCNPGDYPLLWIDSNNYLPDYDATQHPVISQNMFRLKSYGQYSRFEQLGQSWLKHGFVSTNSPGCGTCLPSNIWRPSIQALQNIGGDALGVNCSDTYGASLNGSQGNLGPKNIVDATKGTSPFIRGGATGDNTTKSRLQVPTVDVASQPAGTRFFVDALYITADDAQFVRPNQTIATNALNNASWRELTLASINNSSPTFAGITRQRDPGVLAWKFADPAVVVSIVDHDDTQNPGTGWRDGLGNPSFPNTFIRSRYWVLGKTTDLGGGLFRYEYVVYNHNSDRSANQFSVPMPAGATVTDTFFRAPRWHSGETYSNNAWTNARNGNALTFSTDSFATTPNANALRWGNTFNFGFTTNVAPVTGGATISLFKPGTIPSAPGSLTANNLPVPNVPCTVASVGPITGPSAPVCGGQPVVLSAAGAGTAPVAYQWRKNSANLLNQTAATLTITSATSADSGIYDVVVANGCGSATSVSLTLTVRAACSLADLAHGGACPDGTVDGSDFVAFINSFSTGDVAADALADLAGGGDDGSLPDGIIDGSDFIAFINAFSVGC